MPRHTNSRKSHVKQVPGHASLITVREAAEAVSVTERTVRNWIRNGVLTGYRFGPKLIRVNANELLGLATPVIGEGVA